MIRDFPVNFIAKVPETIEECQELEYKDVDFITLDIDPQYSYYLTTSSYAGVDQQWLLVHSTYGDSKQKDVFERRLRKDMSMGSNALKVLVKQGFPSEAEAKREAENWISKYKRLKFESLDVFKSEVNPNYKIRCHKAEQIPGNIYYITGKLAFDTVFVEKERHSFGRFVLATNNMDLNPNSIFKYYKEMLKVRNCYRFIHDNELCITEPLFKNDERIKGVSYFISFIILISSLLEFMLRSGLKRNGATILNAVHKTTYFPTLSYVFDRFDTFCGILLNEKVTRIVNLIFPINGHTDLLTILGAFGDDYVNFYKYNSGDVPFDEAEFIVRNLYDGSDE